MVRNGKGSGMTTEKKTYTITGIHVEATQRGFIVVLDRKGHRPGDLAYFHPVNGTQRAIDEAYRQASVTAESIKRGRYVGGRDGWTFQVHGKTLTATRSEVN